MTEFEDFHNRIPKRLIAGTVLAAMVIDFMPFSGSLFYWLPEFSAMMLIYWLLKRPQTVNIGTAFVVGLLTDIGTVAPLGLHALSYTVMAFLIVQNHRQIMLFNSGMQAVVVFALLLCNEVVLMLVRLMYDHHFSGWLGLLAPCIGALLWPLLNKLMLFVLNVQRLRR